MDDSSFPVMFGYRSRLGFTQIIGVIVALMIMVMVLRLFALGALVVVVFGGPLLVALAYSVYVQAFRNCYQVELAGRTLVARSMFRTRRVDLAQAYGNELTVTGVGRILLREGPDLFVFASDSGWTDFLSHLNTLHPHQPFQPTLRERAHRAMFGRMLSGFYYGTGRSAT